MEAEWKRRAAFAEIAEALGVNTDEILGATRQGRLYNVIYGGAHNRPTDPIYAVRLARDPAGILRQVGERWKVAASFEALVDVEAIKREVERRLGLSGGDD